MNDCLFCEIAAGRIPSDQIHADEKFVAFRDIAPAAPTHLLVIPRLHLGGLNDLGTGHTPLAGELLTLATDLAAKAGLAAGGYRLVINCGADGGQTVGHLHLHILGGRPLRWPPG